MSVTEDYLRRREYMEPKSSNECQVRQLYQDLLELYGPLIASKHLPTVLAYPSELAFRQAISRKTVPVELFSIENRRGRFARTSDVAKWVASVTPSESATCEAEDN